MSETNHYFDPTAPLHPYTHSLPATPGTLPPPNALRSDAESLAAPAGFWPCEQNGAKTKKEAVRELNNIAGTVLDAEVVKAFINSLG